MLPNPKPKTDFKILLKGQKEYPYLLSQIADPPQKIYFKGEILPEDQKAVAIVGSRRSTLQGQNTAYEFAYHLANFGITIVSGLAQGIDAKAHEGALDAGGRTIAVLGTGIDIVFPEINRALFEKMPRQGAIISEFEPGTPALKHHFPQRNRVISGLALGVLVVEAWEKSGALITAGLALEQNRDVWAIPGSIFSNASKGTNLLIQAGARLVTKVEDILEEIEPKAPQLFKKKKQFKVSSVEEKILEQLDLGPQDIHNLVTKTRFDVKEIITALSFLELKGLVKSLGSNFMIINK